MVGSRTPKFLAPPAVDSPKVEAKKSGNFNLKKSIATTRSNQTLDPPTLDTTVLQKSPQLQNSPLPNSQISSASRCRKSKVPKSKTRKSGDFNL
ncbi:hypothetical protein BSZ32_12320 [Rubritalea profundi]|uniref:Uncharacterized protein n=1 Tax=Rubritalea profundi TaxID=1658618 RepID=A0A2S7U3P9_9BACT|nr:hypothetical protein BSZ32_12320 [Rubritalea profundi]